MPAPYNHSSGVPGVYDRTPDHPDWARVLFREDRIAQASEMMEAQSIIERRGRRVADRVMRDGDRIEGAEIIIDGAADTVTLTAGRVYARGDVRPVAAATLTSVPMIGEVSIGVRIVTSAVTEEDDTALLGLHPGTEAEGEGGAAREVETAVWGYAGDGEAGDLFQVYLLSNGAAVDQTPPPVMSGITQAIALYDRDAHGSYVVRGCEVRALGLIGGAQHFSIGSGTANILGLKRVRETSLRHVEPETPELATVNAETHTFADGGSGTAVITLNRGPIAQVTTAIVTKQKTVTLTKGTTGSLDILPDSSVTSIVSVVQGGTTYAAAADYTLNADRVDWSPAGAEPASGSTYSVTYRYLDAVTPSAVTADTVTLAGGVTGTTVLVSYTWKLPRYDLLCLDADGLPVYVKGVSSALTPRAPSQPVALLALAEVRNSWRGAPEVINTDVRSVPYVELWAFLRALADTRDLVALEKLRSDIDAREPVAKKGIFVDPWADDTYRDQGVAQTAAAFGGTLRLAIDPTFYALAASGPEMLTHTTEVILAQELATACMKINPYQNFTALPASLAIEPPVDFWTLPATEWLSAQTREFGAGGDATVSLAIERVDTVRAPLAFLRQIVIGFTVTGFGPGETLASLTFDGLSVTPAGPLVANAEGTITGTFTVPANVPAGSKEVVATGGSGAVARAVFVGQGTSEVERFREVTTIVRRAVAVPRADPGGAQRVDPLAQTFTLPQARHVTGVGVRFCAVGNPANDVLVEIHPVENGWPTPEILAQGTISGASAIVGGWVYANFPLPVFLPADREFAIMVKTNDPDHALSIGRIGDFDAASQRWVGAQPYSVGVLLSSSNALTWTPHQSEDLTFRLLGARFNPASRTVALGTVSVADMSDVVIRAAVELPTADAGCVFEIVRAGGEVIRLLPGQHWELTEYVTETMQVRAVLTGTALISPTLLPGALLISGKVRASGTYVTRTFAMGSSIRMSAFVKTRLPAGSTLTVEIDDGGGSWSAVTQHAATVLDLGWTEREYRRTPYTAAQGRLRLTLSGSPGARPVLSDMRAVSI